MNEGNRMKGQPNQEVAERLRKIGCLIDYVAQKNEKGMLD